MADRRDEGVGVAHAAAVRLLASCAGVGFYGICDAGDCGVLADALADVGQDDHATTLRRRIADGRLRRDDVMNACGVSVCWTCDGGSACDDPGGPPLDCAVCDGVRLHRHDGSRSRYDCYPVSLAASLLLRGAGDPVPEETAVPTPDRLAYDGSGGTGGVVRTLLRPVRRRLCEVEFGRLAPTWDAGFVTGVDLERAGFRPNAWPNPVRPTFELRSLLLVAGRTILHRDVVHRDCPVDGQTEMCRRLMLRTN